METIQEEAPTPFEQLRNEYIENRYRNVIALIDSSKERYPELYQLPENNQAEMIEKVAKLVVHFQFGVVKAFIDNPDFKEEVNPLFTLERDEPGRRTVALRRLPNDEFDFVIDAGWLSFIAIKNYIAKVSGVEYDTLEDELFFAGHEEGMHRVSIFRGLKPGTPVSHRFRSRYMAQPIEYEALVERLKLARTEFPQYVERIEKVHKEVTTYINIANTFKKLQFWRKDNNES
jgi:hypothetical protein